MTIIVKLEILNINVYMSTAILKGYGDLSVNDGSTDFIIVKPTPFVKNNTKVKRWWRKNYSEVTYEACAIIEILDFYIVVSCAQGVELKMIYNGTDTLTFDVGYDNPGDGNVERILVVPKTEFYNPVNYDDYYYDYSIRSLRKNSYGTGVNFDVRFANASLDLKFAQNKTLTDTVSGNNLVTFTRASSGTFVGADGLIKTTPVNLFRNSQKFTQQWTTDSTGTITIDHAEAPNGTTTANRFVESTGTSSHTIRQALTVSGTYTVSAHFKELPGSAKRYGVIRIHGVGSTAPIAFFDLGNGTVSGSGGTNIISTSITDVGNGWFRCSMTANEPLLSGDGIQIGVTNVSGSFSSYAGDGTSGLLIWGTQLEEGSTATDYIPTTSTTSGAPRFDHDPVTGESLGLLIEEARTNLVRNSEQLDQWIIGGNATVTANAATAPDGTNTAFRLEYPPQSGTYISSNSFITSGTTYTASVYVKAVTPGTNDQFTLSFGGQSANNATSRLTATGEWQRFTATMTPTLSGGSKPFIINNEGDGFRSDIYVWGAQVEEASFATSYIPTTSSQVTRAVDIVEITGTNFSSFYNSTEGTIYSEASFAGSSSSAARIYQFWDPSSTERYHRLLILTATAPFLLNAETKNFFTQASFNSSAVTVGQVFKTAYAFKPADFDVSFSVGASGATSDTHGSTPTGVNQVRLGARAEDGNYNLTGHIKRFAFFAPRLTDSELGQLTS